MLKNQELLNFMGEFTLNATEKQKIIEKKSSYLTYEKTLDIVTQIREESREEKVDEITIILWVARQMYLQGYYEAMENYDTIIRQVIMEKQGDGNA